MLFFHIQGIYNVISLVFSWFALANLWLTFSLVIELLPEQKNSINVFGTATVTHWVNLAFQWIYLAFLALQFVLALGNRPKGEKMLYVTTMIVYAFLSLYLIFCSIFLSIKAFEGIHVTGSGVGAIAKSILTGPANVLLAALVATFGIYLFASFLYRDPWHMFTSFIPYMLLAPSFTNVLNVYAFCNLHDVSWGTKGSDKAEVLPSVSVKKGKTEGDVVEDVVKTDEDREKSFTEIVNRAVTKLKVKDSDDKPTLDDSNKTFRTRLVAAWMLTNAALAVSIENANGFVNESSEQALENQKNGLRSKQQTFFGIILWSTFGLAMVRFVGCLYYFFNRNLFRWCRRN